MFQHFSFPRFLVAGLYFAGDRFLAVSRSGAHFPPLRRDESGKADADDRVIICDNDSGDAIRYHARNGNTESAGKGLPESLKKSSRRWLSEDSPQTSWDFRSLTWLNRLR